MGNQNELLQWRNAFVWYMCMRLNIQRPNFIEYWRDFVLGFKPIPECATLDSRVNDKEEFVILYTEFKWRIGVHFGQNAAKK